MLDLTMADYDGLFAVKAIMSECPTPIIILSALGNTDPDAVFKALEAGAYDYINKPQSALSSKIREISEKIINKVKLASTIDLSRLGKKNTNSVTYNHTFDQNLPYEIMVIGASTGGTGALEEIFKKIPGNFPIPIVVAQHMPHEFVGSFVKRLNEIFQLNIIEAYDGAELKAGYVYFAPGNSNMIIQRDTLSSKKRIVFTSKQFKEYNNPSIDCLMLSAAETYKNKTLAILCTGMGRDGAEGMLEIYKNGGRTIAQDEQTSVVYGMPKAAAEIGAAMHILPIYEIGNFAVSCIA
jgi:two-component system chemotaxis response regulator CheB